jgi:glutamine--fructose-6-phosphate transaminase (EC 2.6.1.16)
VAKNWLESFGMPCQVEVSSEFKSRVHVKPNNGLVITLSQSGETIDTISALEYAKASGFKHSLSICNVAESSLVRMSDLVFMTHAGPEIGVASTKAFTTQLVALLLFSVVIGRRFKLDKETEKTIVDELRTLPAKIDEVNQLEDEIKGLHNSLPISIMPCFWDAVFIILLPWKDL